MKKLGGLLTFCLLTTSAGSANALVCRDVFKGSTHTLRATAVESIAKDVETVSDRIGFMASVRQAAGQPFSVDRRDLDLLLRNAARLLQSQGAKVRAVRYKGFAALELVPDSTARPGWNKMAASLKAKLNARLLFAPATLAEYGSSAHLTEAWDGSRAILISRESLSVGRTEYRVAEEIGHASSNTRELTDPNSFHGVVTSIDPALRPAIAEGTASYRDQMASDEPARIAKNFVRAARALEAGDKNAKREMITIARNGRDVVKVTRAAIEAARAITRSITIGAEGSGISMAYDGSPKSNGAFVYSDKGQVYVERVAPKVVRLNLEGLGVDVEIFVRDTDGALSALIPKLQIEDSNAIRVLQTKLPEAISKWSRDQNAGADGIVKSIEAVARMRTLDDRALAREVRSAADAIGPLIARRPL